MLGDGALDNLGGLGLAVFAVVGGAVAGAAVTALAVWLTCRWLFGKQPPPLVAKLFHYLGALAGALLVAGYLKFGGGTGYFFGSGGPDGTVRGAQSKGDAHDAAAAKSAEEKPAKLDAAPAKQEDRVRVTVLGGALVRGKSFYRLDGSPEAVDLSRVKDAIRTRQKAGPLAGVDILIYQNSLGYNTDPVRQLKAWVAESGLTPNPAELPGDIP